MKRFPLLFLLFLLACSSKQEKKTGPVDENNDYLVSLYGIGDLKVDMSQDELEKLLQQKIPLTNRTDTSGSWTDTATIRYKGELIHLNFVRSYAYEKPDSFLMRVSDIRTESKSAHTANGIGIGSSRFDIVDAYPDHYLLMTPGFDPGNDTTFSKTQYQVMVRPQREGAEMCFYLLNQKVYAIKVGYFYDDQE